MEVSAQFHAPTERTPPPYQMERRPQSRYRSNGEENNNPIIAHAGNGTQVAHPAA